jgi:hypothetical protein
MEHSLNEIPNSTMQNVDETNKQKYGFLNQINEANKMDEQSIEKHIDIQIYESENNKKDSVARKANIQAILD